jgi:hypothetical protein
MGLVLWVAIYVRLILDIFAYVDDLYGWDEEGNLQYYPEYDQMMPVKQVAVLELWDHIGLPHSREKQLWGAVLVIIGFLVDVNELTVTLPTNAKDDLILAVEDFIRSLTRKRSLHDWQQLVGWINWSFNVYPLLHPALCHVYLKILEKENAFATVYINLDVKRDLSWYLDHLRSSSGIFMFRAIDWNPHVDTDFTILCDACPAGMGFWTTELAVGFYAAVPADAPKNTICFWEATCVLSAIEWFCNSQRTTLSADHPARLTIFTDNLNTVQIFSSLSAEPAYNVLLKAAVDLLIEHDVDLRVLHIRGDDNTVADAISRSNFSLVHHLLPELTLTLFQPPQCVLGAAKK